MTRKGIRYQGSMAWSETGGHFRSGAGKQIPLETIAWIRFPETRPLVPKRRVIHQMWLGGEQHLTGELLSLDEKQVRFSAGWGEALIVPRQKIDGIGGVNGFLTVATDALAAPVFFQAASKKPTYVAKPCLTGKKTLLVEANKKCEFLWQKDVPRQGRVSLHFFEADEKARGAWTIEVGLGAAGKNVSVRREEGFYELKQGNRLRLEPSPGWHLMQVEWSKDEMRCFIDDHFMGGIPRPDGEAKPAALSVSASTDSGTLNVDDVQVAAKVDSLSRPARSPGQDEIWLTDGDQVFGSIGAADSASIEIRGKFGKKSYAWGEARAIGFKPISPKPGQAEIWFRPGPGAADDMLLGQVLDLNDARLLVRHEALGEVAVERVMLRRIVFPEPSKN